MDIHLQKLTKEDAKDLFRFECENRAFFEKMVPSRGDEFYDFDTFNIRHQTLLNEQANGISFFYLIKNSADSIVGRINLIDIDRCTAEIGYRIGEHYAGKGIAVQALNLLLTSLPPSVVEIHAKTTSNNIPSQKVLEKNSFKRTSVSHKEIELNDQKLNFIHYVWKKSWEK